MNLKFRTLLILVCVFCHNMLFTQEFEPPYLGHSSNWVMTMFKVKTDKVKLFLPEGIEPKTDEDGMTHLGLEIYEVDDISGLPTPYTISFIFVQIDSVDNKHFPSNFPIWGVYNDSIAANSFSKHYGFPFKYIHSPFSIKKKGLTWKAVLGNNQMINLELTKTLEKDKNEGFGELISKKNKQFLHSKVNWINNGYLVSKTKLKINPNRDPVLKLIEDVIPYWSSASDNLIFSYSKPIYFKK